MYTPDDKMLARIGNDYTYHSPKADQVGRYKELRESAQYLAIAILTMTPPSREQSLALTALEEAVFYANAAIARNE